MPSLLFAQSLLTGLVALCCTVVIIVLTVHTLRILVYIILLIHQAEHVQHALLAGQILQLVCSVQ
jgi:hypothetical protein